MIAASQGPSLDSHSIAGMLDFWCRASCCVPWSCFFGCSIMTVALLDQRLDGNRIWGGSDKTSVIKFIVLVLVVLVLRSVLEWDPSIDGSVHTYIVTYIHIFGIAVWRTWRTWDEEKKGKLYVIKKSMYWSPSYKAQKAYPHFQYLINTQAIVSDRHWL